MTSKQIPVVRSFVDAGALAAMIDEAYELDGSAHCTLFSKMLRTQDNDHYLVVVDGKKYVARVYQRAEHLQREESDYQYELDWLNFLHENDLPVAYPVRQANGRFLGSLLAPEGERYYALFSFAPGQPMDLESENQLYALGAYMARIHKVSNEFETEYERRPMDLEFLADRPIARLQRIWGDHPERDNDLDLLIMSAEEAKNEILELIKNPEQTPDGWGPIGGDFHTHNTFFTDDNSPTFFNFDLCGPGWRAYDIASFLLNTNLVHTSTEQSEAFFAGYYSERPLSDNEHAAISPFLTLRRVWLTATFTRADMPVGYSFIAPANI